MLMDRLDSIFRQLTAHALHITEYFFLTTLSCDRSTAINHSGMSRARTHLSNFQIFTSRRSHYRVSPNESRSDKLAREP